MTDHRHRIQPDGRTREKSFASVPEHARSHRQWGLASAASSHHFPPAPSSAAPTLSLLRLLGFRILVFFCSAFSRDEFLFYGQRVTQAAVAFLECVSSQNFSVFCYTTKAGQALPIAFGFVQTEERIGFFSLIPCSCRLRLVAKPHRYNVRTRHESTNFPKLLIAS